MLREDEKYPMALPEIRRSYPMLQIVAAYGNAIAVLVAAIVLAAGLTAWSLGHGIGWAAAGILLSAFVYLLMRCLAELVHLIADTLIPK